nr:hypothetical protein [Tanacetum cinerariifolium]
MQLFEALEKLMNHDHSEELAQDLAKARKKKKKSRESPNTPPGSPPHQPPPPPLPAGPSVPTEMELELEHTQQGSSHEVSSVYNSLVHSFRALSALRRSGLRTASTAAKPCQGDSSEFYLIIGIIYTDQRRTVISSGSTTTHSDSSLYDSFIFDLSINPFPPADRSDFFVFADELTHIISPPKYDCVFFKIEPNSGDFTMDVVEDTFLTKEPRLHNALPTHPTFQLNMDFILSSESLFTYVRAITELVYLVEAHHHLNPIFILKHDSPKRIDDGVVMLVLEAYGIPLRFGEVQLKIVPG